LFIYGRFKEGLRCKQVIAPTLGVTLAFVLTLFPAEFFPIYGKAGVPRSFEPGGTPALRAR
jgi:hypothetical protein